MYIHVYLVHIASTPDMPCSFSLPLLLACLRACVWSGYSKTTSTQGNAAEPIHMPCCFFLIKLQGLHDHKKVSEALFFYVSKFCGDGNRGGYGQEGTIRIHVLRCTCQLGSLVNK